MGWTDDRVNLLKQLWGEGKTAAEIAKELGDGVTRNAVIGKAHRLKLSSRVSPIQQNNKPKRQKSDRPPRAPKRSNKSIPIFKGKEIPMEELRDKMCRWPNGDPQDRENFSFCGCEQVEGLPYCATHAQIAYQTSTRSRELRAKDFDGDSGAPLELDVKVATN